MGLIITLHYCALLLYLGGPKDLLQLYVSGVCEGANSCPEAGTLQLIG